jgi:hypothetical protein
MRSPTRPRLRSPGSTRSSSPSPTSRGSAGARSETPTCGRRPPKLLVALSRLKHGSESRWGCAKDPGSNAFWDSPRLLDGSDRPTTDQRLNKACSAEFGGASNRRPRASRRAGPSERGWPRGARGAWTPRSWPSCTSSNSATDIADIAVASTSRDERTCLVPQRPQRWNSIPTGQRAPMRVVRLDRGRPATDTPSRSLHQNRPRFTR